MRCLARITRTFPTLVIAVVLLLPDELLADGLVVDKIYHPYVDALEREIEFRSLYQDRQRGLDSPKQIHQLSLGTSIGQNHFAEVKFVSAVTRNGDFDLGAVELEWKWQLTEQGEYFADWGLLFEFEQGIETDIHELVAGFLVEKEFGRFSATANLFLIQEWGKAVDEEFETASAIQARYRHSRGFEPALEIYVGQNSTAAGPALLGSASIGVRKSLHWEAGVMFGLDNESANTTFRVLLEFEF